MSAIRFYIIATTFWIKIFTESYINIWKKLIFGFKRANLPDTLQNKVLVITGGNRGIGLETAKAFAKLGAKVFIGCRNVGKSSKALDYIYDGIEPAYRNNVVLCQLDLASFDSIYNFAVRLIQLNTRIDYLINNAGIMMCREGKSKDGFELQLGTNYLGPFLLTHLLLPRMCATPGARIVNTSSISHNAGIIHFNNINLTGIYTPLKAYGQSKLAVILWTRELAKRLHNTSVNVYSLHPGLVATELYGSTDSTFVSFIDRFFGTIGLITPEQGAQTTLYCALDQEVAHESGHYYKNCKRDNNMTTRVNDADAKRLWELTVSLCGLEGDKMAEVNC